MKKLLFIGLLIVNAGLSAHAAEYLVKYKNESMLMSTMDVMSQTMQVLDQNPAGNLIKVDIPEAKKIKSLTALSMDPNIEYVVPNAKVYAFSAPVDPNALKDQWAVAKIQAEKAWKRAGNKGNKKITVAVIDTGVDYKHKSLAPNMTTGYDFARNDNDPMDQTSSANPGHGTHCAGIVGATGLVDGGTVGMAAEVTLMPIRFLDENGSGDLNNGIKSIDYAIEKKVDVISASWGAAIPRNQAKPLIEAIERAEKAGVVFVVAASNDGKNNDSFEVYPANAGLSNMISVAASNSNDGKPSWSNYGKKVDIAAPGESIISTVPKDQYSNLSGTSMATPLVAGLVAFLKAQDNSLTPTEIKSLLQSTAAKVNIQTACDCRIDAYEATEALLSKKMIVSPFATTVPKGNSQQFTVINGAGPFTFSSSNSNVASIDDKGVLQALADGDTQITVTDAKGNKATSYKIYVGKPQTTPPPDDGGGGLPLPGDPGECPIGNPQICEIICQFQPDLPFCKK